MPYKVNFTDQDKPAIEVFDNTSSKDTSLTFPGRNVVGYGQIIAENFLHILENFASANQPINPVEGQLWYDTDSGVLQLWDSTNWKAASNIQKGASEPSVEESKVGELWVDTTNQQLRIFTGTRWILVGPQESALDGLRYGPAVEQIVDTDNFNRSVLIFYIADVPIIIFSKDSFTPKIGISGFVNIRSGININTPGAEAASEFIGGFLPKVYGIATSADSLNISGTSVPAGRFFRTDTVNTTDFGINVKSNRGITFGVDGNLSISNTATSARIYNSAQGSSLDLQTNRDGIPNTVIRIIDDKVGINNLSPDEVLDVDGNIALTGSLIINNNLESTNLGNGSLRTIGGAAIGKNLIIGTNLSVNGVAEFATAQPRTDITFDLGTPLRRWNTIRARKVIAEEFEGVLAGDIDGNASTATSLKSITSFRIVGDMTSQRIDFDGRPNETTKTFVTSLTANIITDKAEPFPNVSRRTDFILTYRASEAQGPSSGLLKQTRDTFVADLGVPIGGIMPFAGVTAPFGYLLCDGSEVERVKYPQLFDIIGTAYNGSAPLLGLNTFRLPDFRGRFPLGKDDMDNNDTVPAATGGFIDAGGGSAGRVTDTRASTRGGEAGQSSVVLSLGNLPEHTHNLQNGNIQYSVLRVDPAINPPATTGLGPTAPGQAQYLNNSGGVSKPNPAFTFGNPVGIMNPFQTVNYIIRSGPPTFTTN
jgi:microcystin-dependent protein